MDVALEVVGLEGTGGFLHALHLLLLRLYSDFALHCHLLLLLPLQNPSRLPELAVEGINNIINEFSSLGFVHLGLLGIKGGELKGEGEELATLVIGLFANVELEQFALDGLLLVNGIQVGVEVFQGPQVLILDFGLSGGVSTGACAI